MCTSAFTLFLGEKSLCFLMCAVSHPTCPPPAHRLLTMAAGPRLSQLEHNLHKQTNLYRDFPKTVIVN